MKLTYNATLLSGDFNENTMTLQVHQEGMILEAGEYVVQTEENYHALMIDRTIMLQQFAEFIYSLDDPKDVKKNIVDVYLKQLKYNDDINRINNADQ